MSFSWDVCRGCLDPLIEISESEEEIIVTVDLPFVRKDDIEVRVKKDVFIVKAKMEKAVKFERWGGVHRKVSFDSFRKSVKLPVEVETESSEARFEKGLLVLRLKKKKGRKVEID